MSYTEAFRKAVFSLENTYGFIEREQAIHLFLQGDSHSSQAERYTAAFRFLLEQLSLPIREYDLLAGAMAQGEIPYELELVPGDGYSHTGNPFTVFSRCAGHCCPDYDTVLHKGLIGMLQEIEKAATEKGTQAAQLFAANARDCIYAIQSFAKRYAGAAKGEMQTAAGRRRAELDRIAAALEKVPYSPAETFFEAVQAVWLIHLLLSACVGGRDFAFGRLDQILLPYYERDLREGRITEAQALDLLENLLLHCNELGGTVPVQVSYKERPDYKPVPCSSTKQYLVLGGLDAHGSTVQNRLSELFLEAALRVQLIEPVFVVRLCTKDSEHWKHRIHDAAQRLQGQITVFNDDIIVPRLEELGLPPETADSYVMTGCNGVTFPGMQHTEIYHNAPQWLTDVLLAEHTDNDTHPNFSAFIAAFGQKIYHSMLDAQPAQRVTITKRADCRFHLESLFFTQCRENALDIENGGQSNEATVHFIAGAATVVDSLCAIDTLVYREKSLTLEELREILRQDYHGHAELLRRIREEIPKFGNDDDIADRYAALFSGLCHDTIESLNQGEENRLHSSGFYGLYWQYQYGAALPATPDGRLAGEPISENMSPSYGTDQNGVTAMLKSVSALGLRRSTTGGLNIKFTKYMPLPVCTALFDTFFKMGGINYAVTLADRETLLEAKDHPEKHRNLCVRITGYSEYFTRLPEFVQDEIIERTAAN